MTIAVYNWCASLKKTRVRSYFCQREEAKMGKEMNLMLSIVFFVPAIFCSILLEIQDIFTSKKGLGLFSWLFKAHDSKSFLLKGNYVVQVSGLVQHSPKDSVHSQCVIVSEQSKYLLESLSVWSVWPWLRLYHLWSVLILHVWYVQVATIKLTYLAKFNFVLY